MMIKKCNQMTRYKTHVCRTRKNLKQEEIKYNNIIKRYKKTLNLMFQKKTIQSIINIWHKFLIIRTEY